MDSDHRVAGQGLPSSLRWADFFFFILIGHISKGNEICILVKGNGRAGVWRGASHHCQYSPLLARGRWGKDILLLQ